MSVIHATPIIAIAISHAAIDVYKRQALVLVEVNPNFPRTFGDTLVHVSQVDAIVEANHPIPLSKIAPYTDCLLYTSRCV